jgi:hypothetical protein
MRERESNDTSCFRSTAKGARRCGLTQRGASNYTRSTSFQPPKCSNKKRSDLKSGLYYGEHSISRIREKKERENRLDFLRSILDEFAVWLHFQKFELHRNFRAFGKKRFLRLISDLIARDNYRIFPFVCLNGKERIPGTKEAECSLHQSLVSRSLSSTVLPRNFVAC